MSKKKKLELTPTVIGISVAVEETISRLMASAFEARRDRPKLAVLSFVSAKLEEAKICNLEPAWGKILRGAKRIWEEQL